MIGFSIAMWFVSAMVIPTGIALRKGDCSFVHGKLFDTTDDKEGYVKELGKLTLLIGIGISISGIITAVLQQYYSILIAVIFLLFIVLVSAIWFYKIKKRFS